MSENITYTVGGLDSESGHVSLQDFLDRVDHLLTALNEIDRSIGKSGSPKLYYRIIKASHNGSPLTITLEPSIRKSKKTISGDYIVDCHASFFNGLMAVKRMDSTSANLDLEVVEHFREIALGVGEKFKNASISNGRFGVEIDHDFESNAIQLTKEEGASFGTIVGKLDTLNIHGHSRRFWIYPELGPKVRCDFYPGTREQIIEAAGYSVKVTGLKFFRSISPHPFRIKVQEFEVISNEDRVPLERLRGIAPDATGAVSAVEFVRQIRDEWE